MKNIEKYLDECNYYDEKEDFKYNLVLLQKEEHKIEKWLKENGYADECIGAGFESINGHPVRAMGFEYNGSIEELDIANLSMSIAENVIDDRFSVRVSVYDEECGEAYKNLFCVEICLNN